MKKSLIILLVCGLVIASALAGCGSSSTEPGKLVVGATPAPHAEILEEAKKLLQEKGITLEIKVFNDYATPNTALADGSLDANYFQHLPYLEDFSKENNLDLVSAGDIHYEPMGLYSNNITSLSELKDGDKIAVPSDVTNEARALLLLQDNDILTLKDPGNLKATKVDIAEYKIDVEIVELEAAQLARALSDVTAAVINGNYALDAGLNPATDAIIAEEEDSLAAKTYTNIVAVRNGDESREEIKALYEVLTSDALKSFIEDKYKGAVVLPESN